MISFWHKEQGKATYLGVHFWRAYRLEQAASKELRISQSYGWYPARQYAESHHIYTQYNSVSQFAQAALLSSALCLHEVDQIKRMDFP